MDNIKSNAKNGFFLMNRPTNNRNVTLDQIIFGCYQILTELSEKKDSKKNSPEVAFSENKNP
jgi:hypothetical protein